MRAILALWRREFAEHRGAYLWAPLIALAVFIVTAAAVLIRARFELPVEAMMLPVRRLYEDAVLIGFLLWWVYFGAAAAFYLTDAFHADRRNNAILFWKSMPVSDFTILMSKLTFGVLASTSLAVLYAAATGVVLGVLAMFIGVVVPVLIPPTLPRDSRRCRRSGTCRSSRGARRCRAWCAGGLFRSR
jgi:ABC-2 type transport system permease protein